MKKKIILVGGGGHCASCIDVIEQEGNYEIAGIVDSDSSIESLLGYPFLGMDADLDRLRALYDCALVTIGQISGPAVRSRVFLHLRALNYEMPAIVSPRAYVSKHATVGEGTIVLHDALVNARASIGQNCIINTKALIEHDSNIGDNCHVSTGAIVNGGVTLGSGSFLGSNAGTKQLAVVNENEFVRAGTFFVGHDNA